MTRLLALAITTALCASASPPKAHPSQVRVPLWSDAPVGKIDARINNSSAPVLLVQSPGSDLVILIVLDLAGDPALVDEAKKALAGQIQALPANAYVGLLRAQDGGLVLSDPTADHAPALKALEAYAPGGKAGLLDTLEQMGTIADAMVSQSAARTALLYITDSDVANYREDFTNPVINGSDPHDLSRKYPEALVQEKISKLARIVAAQQAPLFIVHLNSRSGRLNEAYQNGLKILAEATSGASELCHSSAEIAPAIQKTFETIQAAYILTLKLPDRARENLQIHLESGEARLTYRGRLTLKLK